MEPRKRARGSYAKLICFKCRERRIKCQLIDDGSIVPSSEPQPPEKACQRCRQQGLECVVRKTTLGRPNQKKPRIPTPSTSGPTGIESRSPSPDADDLVLLTLDEERNSLRPTTSSVHQVTTGVHMYSVINQTFDLTSSLLGRDKRYGSAIEELKSRQPKSLDSILDEELLELLDEHLFWHRLYMPWLPSLTTLWLDTSQEHPRSSRHVSATVLLALLSSIALDVPTDQLSPYRDLRADLQCVVYHTGQKVLFTLPRNDYCLMIFELVQNHKPLALLDSQQAAAHTLSGNLYGTLIYAMQQRLGFDTASRELRASLEFGNRDDIERLVTSVLRWCATTVRRISSDLEEVETARSGSYEPEIVLNDAFDVAAQAIERYALDRCFYLFHVLRYHADELITIRELTVDWTNTTKLSEHIEAHVRLRAQRKKDFDNGLTRFYFNQGRTEEGLALSQLISIEQGQGHSNVIGLAMFYAIMSGSNDIVKDTTNHGHPMAQLSKYYTERINQEAMNHSMKEHTATGEFLTQYGDMHIDALEKRLTDFINAATDVSLHGIPFIGPPRLTSCNVLLACKLILENNAVRIKIDRMLHPRVDMQLILFENAARRLEGMEADGGSPEAVARGSVFTACAKLIRSLHRIMWQWKRSYAIGTMSLQGQQQPLAPDTHADSPAATESLPSNAWPPFSMDSENIFAGGLFLDWDNWAQLGPTEMSNLFTYDFDGTGL